MSLLAKKITTRDSFSFSKACEIRKKVFVDEQNVPPHEEFDDYESISNHYVLLLHDTIIGTARWRNTDKGIKLERFAVLKKSRGIGAGSVLLEKILRDVNGLSPTIYLHAQLGAVRFYERQGFEKKGDIFLECDIEHYLMELK
jgi:predicted GNAT family N-acyltransferase